MKKTILSIGLFFLIGISHLYAQNNLFTLMQDEKANFYEIQALAKKYFDSVGTERGSGYKMYKRWEYDASLQIDKKGFRKTQAEISKEFQRADAHFRKSNARKTAEPSWTELGPDRKTPTSSWSPGVGRIAAIAVSLRNPDLIFIGAAASGVWKSTNGGASWTPLMHAELEQNIRALEIDPVNDNIIFAGTTSGYYKSTDGGNTWALGNIQSGVSKFIFHPTNSNIIFAASQNGLYKSKDGGETWTQVINSNVEDIEFKPGDPNIVYSVGYGGYFKSTNTGDDFTPINSITGSGRSFVAVSPADPSVVYVVQADGNVFGKFYKSTNSGESFTIASSGSVGNNNIFGYELDGSGNIGQAWHDLDIDVSPTNANLIQIGSINSYKSINGGSSWIPTSYWIFGNEVGYNHADVHVMKYFGNVLYAGSDGGIYKSTNNGDDWTDLSAGLGIRQFYRFGLCRANPEIISGGSQDNGSSVRRQDGIWYDWLGADGMEGFIDHYNADILYGTSQLGKLYKSTDRGQTRINLQLPTQNSGNWVTPFRMDPTTNTTLYVGYDNVFKSTNSGDSWTTISNYNPKHNCDEIEVAPSNSNYIITRHNNEIYKTTDGGLNWSNITNPSQNNVNTIAIHPTKPSNIVIGTSAGTVFYSTDFGFSFIQITGASLPQIAIIKIVFDEGATDGFYIGNYGSVFYKDNTMTDFYQFNQNFPTQSVYDLEYHVSTKRIYAATYGRGIWWASAYNSSTINIKPKVAITEPGNKTTLIDPTSIIVSANAEDSDGIKNVQFYANNTLIGTDTDAPYSINWTSGLKIGTYSLTAVATDNLGGKTTSTIIKLNISASNNKSPTIFIMNPKDGQIIDESTQIVFSAVGLDEDGTVDKIQFLIDGVLVSTIDNSDIHSYIAKIKPGSHTLFVIVTDNRGQSTEQSINFVVRKLTQDGGFTQIPQVEIINPIDNQGFVSPANININANASDADGTISKVEFYNGTTKLGESTEAPFTLNWNNVQGGDYKLTAVAIDNQGATDTSDVVNIKVELTTIINDALQENETFIYPNPASDVLYIRSPEMINKEYLVQITDVKGNFVFNQNLNLLNTYALNLKPFNNGLYVIKIKDGGISRTTKFEVKR